MMYSFESSGSRKPLHAMVIGALAGAAVLFSFGTLPDVPLPSLFQMGAILCATCAVYLTVRYSLRTYRYAIQPNTIVDAEGVEQYDLVITEITGKKMKVVCRVGLRTVAHDAVTVVIRRDNDPMAKTARDRFMEDLDREYPVTCFAGINGYSNTKIPPFPPPPATSPSPRRTPWW